jgi:hypothetical protein
MTIYSNTTSVVHPGRLQDAIGLAGRAAKIIERHGGSGSRLLAAATAGEATGTLTLVTEYADGEVYGAASDGLVVDPELQQLQEEARSAETPVTIVGQVLTSQIPLDRAGNTDRGSYVEVHISRATPGRFEEVLDLGRRVADFVEERGATNANLSTTFLAGTSSGQLVFSYELPSLRSFGRLVDAWTTDPEGIALSMSIYEADPASVEIFSGLYAVVPL